MNTTGTTYQYLYDWVVSEGCRSQRIPATFVVNAYPPMPIISQNGNTLSSTAPAGNQWIYNGGILAGQTGQTLTITQTGTYTVAVTVNGCTTLSPPYVVTSVGITEPAMTGGIIYPNPVTHSLHIEMNAGTFLHRVAVYDISGKIIYYVAVTDATGKLTVTTATWPEGVYLLEVTSSEGVMRKRFTVVR